MNNKFVIGQPRFGYDPELIESRKDIWHDQTTMNNDLISKWNDVVGEKEDVYVLGEMFDPNFTTTERFEIIRELNGIIHYIPSKNEVGDGMYQDAENKIEKCVLILDSFHVVQYGSFRFALEYLDDMDFNQKISISLISHESNVIDRINVERFYYPYQGAILCRNCLHYPIMNVIADRWNFTPINFEDLIIKYRHLF